MVKFRKIHVFPHDPRYTITVTLSGVDFRLSFDFHEREQRYYLDISRSTGEEVARGVKVVENWPLLKGVATRFRPVGELYAYASVGGPPLLHELGHRVKLLYAVFT